MAEVLELDCSICDGVFTAKRSHARYCSDACRNRSRRLRRAVNMPVKSAAMSVAEKEVEPLGTVVLPPRYFIAPEEGRADGKPLRPLSDEEYAVRLEAYLAQCVEGHEWHRWPAGLVSCLRCYSQLVAPDE